MAFPTSSPKVGTYINFLSFSFIFNLLCVDKSSESFLQKTLYLCVNMSKKVRVPNAHTKFSLRELLIFARKVLNLPIVKRKNYGEQNCKN